MIKNTLFQVIPHPAEIIRKSGRFVFDGPIGIYDGGGRFAFAGKELAGTLAKFGVGTALEESAGLAKIELSAVPGFEHEAYKIEVLPERIIISGGGEAGVLYGVYSLEQMLHTAFITGRQDAKLDCGIINDRPRFRHRGFMLDSARHFQSVETICKVIDMMAKFKLNIFHWHLCDGECGWRAESRIAPELNTLGSNDSGFFTAADIARVADYAECRNIEIVPEIEMPGHSAGILSKFPQFSCNPAAPGCEICLGNPEARAFLKSLIKEYAGLFPKSRMIHIGGDEALTSGWEKCPKCLAAMRENGFSDLRKLENEFMCDMAEYVLSLGLIPVGWGTESTLPEKMCVQVWRDFHELERNFRDGGNRVLNSTHYTCYFDYPLNDGEPAFEWMTIQLPEEAVYRCNPYAHYEELLGDALYGVEAALWTELVPEWRVMAKIVPRLPAFAENAWSMPENKDYMNYCSRRRTLDASGFFG